MRLVLLLLLFLAGCAGTGGAPRPETVALQVSQACAPLVQVPDLPDEELVPLRELHVAALSCQQGNAEACDHVFQGLAGNYAKLMAWRAVAQPAIKECAR